MKIDSDYIYATQFRRFSGTRKIAGVNLPDFSERYVYTRNKTNTTDAEYEKAIIAQAQKDYLEGAKFQRSQGYIELQRKYVSEVSPEREKIITEGMLEIEKNGKSTKEVRKSLSLLDLLFIGKLEYTKCENTLKYAEFYDKNGESVAFYANGGWTTVDTKAESARKTKMTSIYNEAYKAAMRADKAKGKEVSEELNSIVSELESTFDKKA